MLEIFRHLTDKHYKMERFSISFSVLSVLMIAVVCMCAFGHRGSMANSLSDVSLSQQSFTMSKSGVSGTIERLYASEDKTRAFMLLKFEDVANISTNAENWQAYLTSADTEGNPEGVRGVPSGSIYFFGTTGYAGVLLVNEEQFIPQVLRLVLRCNSELVSEEEAEKNSSDAGDDATFEQYDQADISFNPGANAIEPLPCLNDAELPDANSIYGQAVVAYSEADTRRKLDLSLNKMKADLEQISEYENRLGNDGLMPPERPDYIGSDSIEQLSDGGLQLVTDTVCEGGYSYDWRSGSVFAGYLDKLKAELNRSNMTDDAFFSYMETQGDYFDDVENSDPLSWTLADGTTLATLAQSESNTNRYNRLNNEATALTSAWNNYIQDKKEYQSGLLRDLLVLEADITDVSQLVTIHSGCLVNF